MVRQLLGLGDADHRLVAQGQARQEAQPDDEKRCVKQVGAQRRPATSRADEAPDPDAIPGALQNGRRVLRAIPKLDRPGRRPLAVGRAGPQVARQDPKSPPQTGAGVDQQQQVESPEGQEQRDVAHHVRRRGPGPDRQQQVVQRGQDHEHDGELPGAEPDAELQAEAPRCEQGPIPH